MLTVFEVGQGDSCLLHPPSNCAFTDPPLLIDCGYKKAQVHRLIPGPCELAVLITHSHRDHIGGLVDVLNAHTVTQLFIPRYAPEVIRIANYLGNRGSHPFGPFTPQLLNGAPIHLVSEGDELSSCKHIKVLNPPFDPDQMFPTLRGSVDELPSIETAIAGLREFGIELSLGEIIEYRTDLPPDTSGGLDVYRGQARTFVHLFFRTLYQRLRATPRVTGAGVQVSIQSHLQLTANQASVVFIYSPEAESDSGRWLFTGDADIHVFDRIRSAGVNLRADYLKVPHHGSSENLDLATLRSISPKIAIISHGNRSFGNSTDTHPHQQVIDLLDAEGVDTHFTNDVVKQGVTTRMKTVGAVPGAPITFA